MAFMRDQLHRPLAHTTLGVEITTGGTARGPNGCANSDDTAGVPSGHANNDATPLPSHL
jgi:hypothetical protein